MSKAHRSAAEPHALRIAEWLADHRDQFEDGGINEDSLPAALQMSEKDVTAAVDHLENREVAVRSPHPMSSPPSVAIKAGRGWPEMREEILKKRVAG